MTEQEIAKVVKEAYNRIPKTIKDKLLFKGDEWEKGAKKVRDAVTNGNVVQLLTHIGKDANGKDVEKGIVYMFPNAEILPHSHQTDNEAYQEITPNGLVVDGECKQFEICKMGESHSAEATPTGGIVAWEWHEDGNNLDFVPQQLTQEAVQ